jgi:hypothetical protein
MGAANRNFSRSSINVQLMKVAFYTVNYTGHLHPLDFGVIQCLKSKSGIAVQEIKLHTQCLFHVINCFRNSFYIINYVIVFIFVETVSLTTYVNKVFYHNYKQQVLQEDEQFLKILHNPHLMKTSIWCKKNHSPRGSLNRDFTVLYLLLTI